jgi:hypothetical protein
MKKITNDYWSSTRVIFVAPTLGAAAEKSAFFRVDGHTQVQSPITGASAGMVTGHRPWSPPIT